MAAAADLLAGGGREVWRAGGAEHESDMSLIAHEIPRHMVAQVHRTMQDAADFHLTVARAVDGEMAAANPRPAGLVDVVPQPSAFGRGGDFLQRIPQGVHILHGLLPAPLTDGVGRG